MKLKSREQTAWAQLVTVTVKRAMANAEQCLHGTNHTITSFLTPA
jgi:hypothetical protein